MPFDLRNPGETYQHTVQNCLEDKIGHNVHTYVDDIVLKIEKADSMITYLQETFANLHTFHMNLNPAKCNFGVPASKLLGYIISKRGIEANPKKNKRYHVSLKADFHS